jgi:hypothetical protein
VAIDEQAALLAEVLCGRPARALPDGVVAALAELERAASTSRS